MYEDIIKTLEQDNFQNSSKTYKPFIINDTQKN